MTLWVLLILGFGAMLPGFVLGWVNLGRYRRAPVSGTPAPTSVTVCIPARNEERNIEACVRSALAGGQVSGAPQVEVVVYDDQSSDSTKEIVLGLAQEDPRVRLEPSRPLPSGWNGKQHACDCMGRSASTEWLLFTDADVRFEPDFLRRTLLAQEELHADLVSTAPKEVTGSVGEMLLVPLINWVLLCYLPFGLMRRTLRPSASAAIGQYLFCRRTSWEESGGHAAFQNSMHDGVKMPRAFRSAGFRTDLFDGTDLVSCRMYEGFGQTWRGFAKNAYEGLGSFGLLVMVTVMHFFGYLLPWALLIWILANGGFARDETVIQLALVVALLLLPIVQRFVMAWRFQQSMLSPLLHPFAIACLTAVQWWSLYLDRTGKRQWRERTAATTSA